MLHYIYLILIFRASNAVSLSLLRAAIALGHWALAPLHNHSVMVHFHLNSLIPAEPFSNFGSAPAMYHPHSTW